MYKNGKHSADEKKMEGMIKRALNDASEKGKALFSEGFQTAREALKEKSRNLRDKAQEINGKTIEEITDDVTSYVQENPWKSLGIAVGVGFLLGMIFKPKAEPEPAE